MTDGYDVGCFRVRLRQGQKWFACRVWWSSDSQSSREPTKRMLFRRRWFRAPELREDEPCIADPKPTVHVQVVSEYLMVAGGHHRGSVFLDPYVFQFWC
jgi:hypothetical protein